MVRRGGQEEGRKGSEEELQDGAWRSRIAHASQLATVSIIVSVAISTHGAGVVHRLLSRSASLVTSGDASSPPPGIQYPDGWLRDADAECAASSGGTPSTHIETAEGEAPEPEALD
jgi:hypothetical protein